MKFAIQASSRAGALAGARPAPAADAVYSSQEFSLRTKGLLVLFAVFAYMLAALAVVTLMWHESLATNARIEELRRDETRIELLQSSLSHAVINLQDAIRSGNPKDLDTDVALLLTDARRLHESYASLVPHSERLGLDLARLDRDMTSQTVLSLRANLEAMGAEVKIISERVHDSKRVLTDGQFRQQGFIVTVGLSLSLGGVTLFGVMMILFFNHLARDLKRLQARAIAIVTGYDGQPLELTRGDEVGGLMHALNRTQQVLRQREKQIELSRQERFYQEKMAAIGSLAAGVAHEINNPIAAISGIAQHILDTRESDYCAGVKAQAQLILEQTRRIALISHQLADLVATQSQEPDLLDLNGLVQSVANFLGYDKRFGGIEVTLDLDRNLAAVHSVADHLTQILMNLLINAADALEGVSGRKRAIQVATRAAGDAVQLTVRDNGLGMDEALLARVFDESFTTKPLGKGRGLGLFLCKSLIEQSGGGIELESARNAGTTAHITLPLRRAAAS